MRRPAAVIADSLRLAMPLGDFLEQQAALGRPCVVEIIGANRAPPEAYLPELLEATSRGDGMLSLTWTDITGKARGGGLVGPVLFLLGFTSGKSTFPFAEPLSRELPICAVDHEWGDEEDDEPSPKMPLKHLPARDWASLTPKLVSSRQERLLSTLLLLGMAELDARGLATVMLGAGRAGYTAEAPAGVASRLQEALSISPAPTFDDGPQRETGAY
jgi:hypothetical protein